MIPAYQYFPPNKDDKEDLVFIELTEISAIIPPFFP